VKKNLYFVPAIPGKVVSSAPPSIQFQRQKLFFLLPVTIGKVVLLIPPIFRFQGKKVILFLPLLIAVTLGGCIAPPMKEGVSQDSWTVVKTQYGLASWYGEEFRSRITASGEIFDPEALTAAHRDLPFNTMVRVINRNNNRSVIVRINDRGPWNEKVTGRKGRIIDLSWAAAQEIGLVGPGVVEVKLEILVPSW